jgi:hypothetical protein
MTLAGGDLGLVRRRTTLDRCLASNKFYLRLSPKPNPDAQPLISRKFLARCVNANPLTSTRIRQRFAGKFRTGSD